MTTITQQPSRPLARMSARRWVALASLATTMALAVMLAVGGASDVRLVVCLAFFMFVPGWSVVGLTQERDPALTVAAALGLSLALDIIVAEAMLLTHFWRPVVGFGVLAAVSAALLALQLRRSGGVEGA